MSGTDGDVISLEDGTSRKDPETEFQLLEKLGEGSYGSVWKAMHRSTSSIIAIKKVGIDNDLEDIMKEIEFMKGCKSDYIVRYYGSYFKDNELWIVMEYCGAGSVCDMMKICDKTLSEEQIAVLAKDVLQGLAYLHSLRKIHRDIKAGNILLNNKGRSKLADFGVSGQLSDTMAKRQTVIGTPFWMAPEVIQEVGYDAKADIWSFGITCIEMAESKPPYSNIHPMRAIFMIPSRPPPRLTEPEKWSADFNDFVAKSLTKNPEQRPSAKELLEHPFVKKAKDHRLLQPMLDQQEQIISRLGRDHALGIDSKDDEDSDEDDDDDSDGAGTVRRPKAAGQDDDQDNDLADSGTMIISGGLDGFGTVVISHDDDTFGTTKKNDFGTGSKYVPPFLDHLNKKDGSSNASSTSVQNNNTVTKSAPKASTIKKTPTKNPATLVPPGNPKFTSMSLDELKKLAASLDAQKEKEIAMIKEKYAQNKKSIMSAIEERKLSK